MSKRLPLSTLAIGRERPTVTWLLILGGYLLPSFGFMFGADAYFEMNSNISGSQRVMLIVLECAVAAMVAVIPTGWHIIRYYRRRSQQFQFGAHVKELYSNRTWLQDHYHEFLNAEEKVILCGMSLHTFMTDARIPPALQNALSTKEELHIHLLFQRPYSVRIRQRENEEGTQIGRISGDCQLHLSDALHMKVELGPFGSRLHVHVCDEYTPVGFMLLSDRHLFFEPYLLDVGRQCPMFRMECNNLNQKVFDKFESHLLKVIHRSHEFKTAEFAAPQITSVGVSDHRSGITKAVFMDRDGLLIEDKNYLNTPDDIVVLPGVFEGLSKLMQDYRLIIVTNQSGVARGIFGERDLIAIHQRLLAIFKEHGVEIDAIYYCPHHPEGSDPRYSKTCTCRKPAPGMLLEAIKYFNTDCTKSFMIGDKQLDIEAGRAAGVQTILIGNKTNEKPDETSDHTVQSFKEIVDVILAEE